MSGLCFSGCGNLASKGQGQCVSCRKKTNQNKKKQKNSINFETILSEFTSLKREIECNSILFRNMYHEICLLRTHIENQQI